MRSDPQLFWTMVAAVGQAAGALATAAAVIVSLWIALSERRVRLRVACGLRLTFAGDGSPGVGIVAVSVTNTGHRRVRIGSIGWETGWSNSRFAAPWIAKQYAVQMAGVGSPAPPFDLEPGANSIMYMQVADFHAGYRLARDAEFFGRKLPWRAAIAPARILCTVHPTVGPPTKVKAEPSLAIFLTTGELTPTMIKATAAG